MLPEDWQTVGRVLLACCFDQTTANKQLGSVISTLRRSLPATKRILLTCEPDGYALNSAEDITQQFNSQCFSLVQVVSELADRNLDAALIFTEVDRSPYALAYLCYLAGIPIRVGQSIEFGGSVLSSTVSPPVDLVTPAEHHRHLLYSIGLLAQDSHLVSSEYYANSHLACSR